MYGKLIPKGLNVEFGETSEITGAEHIDCDVTGILRRDQTIDSAGDALIEMIVRTAIGRLTAAEALGHREFSLTKLYRSA